MIINLFQYHNVNRKMGFIILESQFYIFTLVCAIYIQMYTYIIYKSCIYSILFTENHSPWSLFWTF